MLRVNATALEPLPPAPASTTEPPSRSVDNPVALGIACCVFGAIAYSVANGLLRMLAVECDRVWVLFVKEVVTVAGVVPWLVYQGCRGKLTLPSRRVVGILVVAGLMTQLTGNLPNLWSLSVIGLTVAVPLTSGVSLAASAIAGRVLLGEALSVRSMIAIGLLIASVILLSLGAEGTNEAIAATANVATGSFWVTLAFAVAMMTGLTYCCLSVAIRHSLNGNAAPWVVLLIVPSMGVLCFAPLGIVGSGTAVLPSIAPQYWLAMIGVGLLNLVGFGAYTKGLQSIQLAHANVLNTSQVALGAVTGIMVFHEPPSPWLTLGIVLTITSMVLIGRSAAEGPTTPETPI
jgi:drug/metabolite transporter, DME family